MAKVNDNHPTTRMRVLAGGEAAEDHAEPDEETEPGRPQRVSVVAMYRAIKELREDIAGLSKAVHGLLSLIRWCAISAAALALAVSFLWWVR